MKPKDLKVTPSEILAEGVLHDAGDVYKKEYTLLRGWMKDGS